MHTVGLQLQKYKRYVDDINMVMSVPAPGAAFMDDELTQDPNERCMNILKTTADGFHPSIEVEVDHPSCDYA